MNQLAFSTLGCPAWDLDRIIHAARDYGYDALEWRGYLADVDLTQAEPFLVGNLAQTRRRLDEAGLRSACVSSSGVVAKGNTDHVKGHAEIARALGAPFVRVFGGSAADGETRATPCRVSPKTCAFSLMRPRTRAFRSCWKPTMIFPLGRMSPNCSP